MTYVGVSKVAVRVVERSSLSTSGKGSVATISDLNLNTGNIKLRARVGRGRLGVVNGGELHQSQYDFDGTMHMNNIPHYGGGIGRSSSSWGR
jgi:hypothetical protein